MSHTKPWQTPEDYATVDLSLRAVWATFHAWEETSDAHFTTLDERPESVQIALRFVRAAREWKVKPDLRLILGLPPMIQSLAKDVFPGAAQLDEPDIPRKGRRD